VVSGGRPWRSGWCGIGARGWQHARCSGRARQFGDAGRTDVLICSCECHALGRDLARLVERHDLVGLIAEVDDLIAGGGLIPPALQRLNRAAREVLDEAATAQRQGAR
jgi:hypothetical protein